MYPTVCASCGNRYVAQDSRQKRCYTCLQNRNHNAPKGPLEFIGVDGEGVTRPDGSHEYILLSVGPNSLYYPDGRQLTWYDIIPFLWENFLENPEAAYVGFFLSYDFTQWLKHLPENRARMLLTDEGINRRKRSRSGANHRPFPVEHRGWELDFLGLKRFRFRETGAESWMYICDTGAYFQTSFLNAIDPNKWPDGPIVTDAEFKTISEGKAERGTVAEWGSAVDPQMIAYNVLENDVLGRLMKRYNEGLHNVGIRLKRDQWFGPGQAAQAWLNNIQAPKREAFEEVTPIEIRQACRDSYYGGWFEIFAHGHIPGRSYAYDINSAYPDIQSNLPCCVHGTWTSGSGEPNESDISEFCLRYATLNGSTQTQIRAYTPSSSDKRLVLGPRN